MRAMSEQAVTHAQAQQDQKSDKTDTDGTHLSERRFIGRNNARASLSHAESMASRCFCCKSFGYPSAEQVAPNQG